MHHFNWQTFVKMTFEVFLSALFSFADLSFFGSTDCIEEKIFMKPLWPDYFFFKDTLFQNILAGRSLLANTSMSWIDINLSKDKAYLKINKNPL